MVNRLFEDSWFSKPVRLLQWVIMFPWKSLIQDNSFWVKFILYLEVSKVLLNGCLLIPSFGTNESIGSFFLWRLAMATLLGSCRSLDLLLHTFIVRVIRFVPIWRGSFRTGLVRFDVIFSCRALSSATIKRLVSGRLLLLLDRILVVRTCRRICYCHHSYETSIFLV